MSSGFIGLDIGGTKIESVFWKNGRIVSAQKVKTPSSRKFFFEILFSEIVKVKKGNKPKGIGISCAGAIDHKRGVILNSPNLKFLNGLKLAESVSKKFRMRAVLENDVNCFLIGEHAFGQARHKKHVVALTLGTGVGGAVLVDGELLHGFHGSAGELGHMVIDSGKSVEDLVSSHVFERYKDGGALAVQHRAEAGEEKAKLIYKKLGEDLGLALASLVNIFDPELIVLGGGIARGKHLFLTAALKNMRRYSLLPKHLLPPVKISRLKHAAALGAISLLLKSR